MSRRKICSDKPEIPADRKEKPGKCFKKGVRVGFAQGVKTGVKQQATRGVRVAGVRKKRLSEMTLREMAEPARELGIRNTGRMRKAELSQALRNAGYRPL
jgi:hypothetical protein